MTNFEKVGLFMKTFGQEVKTETSFSTDKINKLRVDLIEEELEELKEAINNKTKLNISIFSQGHRVPQGLTILNEKIFNVEHGPKGGDELNLVIKGKNYGWPNVSYGTNYLVY